MNKETSLNNLLYIHEHLSCRNYLEKVENGFKYIEFEQDAVILEKEIMWNHILFVLEGECIINYNQFKNRKLQAESIILLPKMATMKVEVTAGTRLLSLSFGISLNLCDKFALQSLTKLCDELDYNFEPLKIHYPLQPFLELVTHCLNQKMDCGHFHSLLQQELFFLLRGFYKKEELALLFYPILATELSFKDFVIENYTKVNNVNELISLSNMRKCNFYSKFKQVFGVTAKQWLLKQRNQYILDKVMTSETTIGELMEELNFESQAYFTHYCKQHFDCTPRELIMKYQAIEQ